MKQYALQRFVMHPAPDEQYVSVRTLLEPDYLVRTPLKPDYLCQTPLVLGWLGPLWY